MTGKMKRNNYKVFVVPLLFLAGIMLCATPSFAGMPLGAACTAHNQCASGNCSFGTGQGCVPRQGTGKPNDFCTRGEQCSSGYCQLADGIRGKCTTPPVLLQLGAACAQHGQCASGNCDNRPGRGCVPRQGTGKPNDFCTVGGQCSSGYCQLADGIRGKCTTPPVLLQLGAACAQHGQCASGNCDNRPGRGCVPRQGTGKPNDFCTVGGQCSSGYCQLADGIRGKCTTPPNFLPLGAACRAHNQCASGNCSFGTGQGCVPRQGTGKPNDFCTRGEQCSSGYCQLADGIRGKCTTPPKK